MEENVTLTGPDGQNTASPFDSPVSFLAQEYGRWQELYDCQPALNQRFIEGQARVLADALVQNVSQVTFRLPDHLKLEDAAGKQRKTQAVPGDVRDQLLGGIFDRLTRTSLSATLSQRLDELEAVPNTAVAASAGLIRYATAMYLVDRLLPAGRNVTYRALEGEEIPSIPVEDRRTVASAITAETDAIVEEAGDPSSIRRGSLQVPFVPAARRFYLPQWVALDDQDHLIAGSLNEAEAHLASMQRFLRILHMAVSLAPYMVADEQYQRKRYGMLGQLVNQGRALARYQTKQIIDTIRRRAAANDLNRGLSLSLPYFDDQVLEMKTHDFQVIPAGRIMFVPAFVVRACRQEEAKVGQDTRLSPSTRKHLLVELKTLEAAFDRSQD